jgi:hypothetical protein
MRSRPIGEEALMAPGIVRRPRIHRAIHAPWTVTIHHNLIKSKEMKRDAERRKEMLQHTTHLGILVALLVAMPIEAPQASQTVDAIADSKPATVNSAPIPQDRTATAVVRPNAPQSLTPEQLDTVKGGVGADVDLLGIELGAALEADHAL